MLKASLIVIDISELRSSGVSHCPTYQHDGDLLAWRQQLQAQALRYRDQAVLVVGVQAVTFLRQVFQLSFL